MRVLRRGSRFELDSSPRFIDMPSMPDTSNYAAPIADIGAYERRD